MTIKLDSRILLPVLLGSVLLSASGCKLSDLVDSDDESTSFVALQGRAANADGPMASAVIEVKDSNPATSPITLYANSSGYFSLVQDSAAEDYVELSPPIIIRTDYNDVSYNSVLCNIVYGNLSDAVDTVNIHPLTEFVMYETTGTSSTAYENWTTGASDQYCNEMFAVNFNNTAASLGTDFNFFNTLFSANGTGFDALLRDFSPEGFPLPDASPEFHISDSLGSLTNFAEGLWRIEATGSVGSSSISRTFDESDITITLPDLRAFAQELIEEASEADATINSLTVSIQGDGIGEIGSTVSANLRGSASLSGASAVSRSFNIDINVERIDQTLGAPL